MTPKSNRPLPATKGVLFDFDGVLMQSVEDHFRSWNAAFGEYGARIGWEEFALLEGQSLYRIAEQLGQIRHLDLETCRRIGARKNEVYMATSAKALYQDAIPCLEFLTRRGTSLALVTGGHRDRFDVSVDASFRSFFGAIVTADDVEKTKPNPEPYLKAASMLRLSPDTCVVVENAPLGIQAAKGAGMFCIALTTTLASVHLVGADVIVDSLSAFVELFESAGEAG